MIGHAWPLKSGLLAGVVVGIVVATIVDETIAAPATEPGR
jgi:hypothetical protein